VGENNQPLLSPLPECSAIRYIAAIKRNHAIKKYFESSVSKTLIIGQLNRISPRAKRKIKISLTIGQYYNKTMKFIQLFLEKRTAITINYYMDNYAVR
jgi:hypothetical protein